MIISQMLGQSTGPQTVSEVMALTRDNCQGDRITASSKRPSSSEEMKRSSKLDMASVSSLLQRKYIACTQATYLSNSAAISVQNEDSILVSASVES